MCDPMCNLMCDPKSDRPPLRMYPAISINRRLLLIPHLSNTMLSLLITALSLTPMVQTTIQGQTCSNMSYYGEVEFVEDNTSCCSSNIAADPVCTTVTQEACTEIIETVCDVQLTTECTLVDCPITQVEVNYIQKTFISKKCGIKDVEIECMDDMEIPYTICEEIEYTSKQKCLECKVGMVV